MDLKFLRAYYAYLTFIFSAVLAVALLGHTGVVIILSCVTTVLIYDAYVYKKELDRALRQLKQMSADIKIIHEIDTKLSKEEKDELK